MNLYLFNENDSAARFGIGTYLNELTHALKGADIHIRIVHLHSTRPEFLIEKTDEIENWHIPEVRNQNTFDGPIQKVEDYFRNVIYLLRLNIKDTANLVFHFNYNLSYALAKGLKEVFVCKTVTTIHFMKWALELHGNLSRFRALKSKPEDRMNPFEQFLKTTDDYESLLYKVADRVIALSNYTKKLLIEEYHIEPDKIAVIQNGLADERNFSDTVKVKANLRRKWHIPENELLIVFAGRLQGVKGLTFLIRAFRKVLDIIPDCRLLIAGNGHFDSYICESKDLCSKISFAGLLEKKELYEIYQIADIGVMPSLHEQCSYVAIEMMMHGIPLITSTSAGLKEMVEDGITGFHVPVTEQTDKKEIDTDLLAEKILNILQNSDERKKMGEHARKRFEELYTSNRARKNMLELYNQL